MSKLPIDTSNKRNRSIINNSSSSTDQIEADAYSEQPPAKVSKSDSITQAVTIDENIGNYFSLEQSFQ